MTLHINLVCDAFVMQVGDRLLTTNTGGNVQEWDPYANKSALFVTRNANIILSYRGLAFINDKPTDQWLIERITGTSSGPPMAPGLGPGIWIGPPLNLDLGKVRDRILEAVNEDFPKQHLASRKANGLEVLISGWTWTRRAAAGRAQPRAFVYCYEHTGQPGATCAEETWPRPLHRPGGWSVNWMPGLMPSSVRDSLAGRLALGPIHRRAGDPDNRTEIDVEGFMLDAIRESGAAQTKRTIGTECMSIVISRQQHIKIRFLRDTSISRPRTAYTPWFIGPSMVSPPAVLSGSATFSFGGGSEHDPWFIPVECVPPWDGTTSLSRMTTQARRPPAS